MKKIVVIGSGAAGAKSASKAKRLDFKNHVEIFTKDIYTSVSLCGLPYFIEGSVKDINDLIVRTPEQFLQNGIPVYTQYELQEILPDKNCVVLNGNHIFYDELILALGANVNMPDIENIDCDNVFTLHSIEDALKIKSYMTNAKKVLIIGAGYIAIELAQAFIKNDINVVMSAHSNTMLTSFDDDFSHLIQNNIAKIAKDKIEIRLNEKITSFEKVNNSFKKAFTATGEAIEADFCVISTGITPNVEIAKKSGIKIGSTGAIYVDNKMRTNIQNIYAAGDCAEKYSIITKKPLYIGLGAIANKEGRIAAINAVGNSLENFDGILASAITGFFNLTISKTGLSLKRALELSSEVNLEPISVTVEKKDKAGYMPNSNTMTLKIIADKRSGELLGAQGLGCANIAQRINTITSLLKTRATVNELLDLDLAYAPPFSGSIDPVLTAAYKLKELLNN
ncbi:MAG: FAD-dependent oxidoreductase [Candidatus Gastranaerophilales bacterium]|nr:FAD-dependent oxidoreductase [Candidatus Gastranaerophilales bacterium]